MRVAANLTMLFEEAGSLLQRYEVAADAGFKCIEISSPYGVEAEQLRDVQEKLGLELVQINSPPAGMTPTDVPRVQSEQVFVENLTFAAKRLAEEGIICLIEPLNHHTVPGYFLSSYEQALGYLQTIKQPNLKIQLDTFHTQYICGQLTKTIKDLSQHIGHVQVAQVPDRHEPHSSGEINYDYVFKLLQDTGYDGFIGAEYIPEKSTTAGLGWIDKYGLSL
uniref:Putative hydroxypyruvate isomerase n=1 Tax=Plectus sambesii TaxID=2011161 RepID=A0A914VW23_9BILA